MAKRTTKQAKPAKLTPIERQVRRHKQLAAKIEQQIASEIERHRHLVDELKSRVASHREIIRKLEA